MIDNNSAATIETTFLQLKQKKPVHNVGFNFNTEYNNPNIPSGTARPTGVVYSKKSTLPKTNLQKRYYIDNEYDIDIDDAIFDNRHESHQFSRYLDNQHYLKSNYGSCNNYINDNK